MRCSVHGPLASFSIFNLCLFSFSEFLRRNSVIDYSIESASPKAIKGDGACLQGGRQEPR